MKSGVDWQASIAVGDIAVLAIGSKTRYNAPNLHLAPMHERVEPMHEPEHQPQVGDVICDLSRASVAR
ncbi:MAG: hypothetical protein ETSY2_30985 [Candidatus Entotheonella gemina]|uniref:Uncharacterized protein n=1 Tax=Candidatus Entotheonella gemina TaxID=1429439 RepID=W4M273_9BACT|nr:MAG: hypothetical protein ETSY2_30985 [Candidatus Entotheonella gemina]